MDMPALSNNMYRANDSGIGIWSAGFARMAGKMADTPGVCELLTIAGADLLAVSIRLTALRSVAAVVVVLMAKRLRLPSGTSEDRFNRLLRSAKLGAVRLNLVKSHVW